MVVNRGAVDLREIHYVEAWGRRFRRFSLHVHLGASFVGMMRERVYGGRGFAAVLVDGAAFVADFERALWVVSRRRRVLLVGALVMELPVAMAGRIAGMTPGESYWEYEWACHLVFGVMERGGYAA